MAARGANQSNRGKINLYEIKQLKRLEIEVLGRALASSAFKEEMFAVNKRITKIRATNSLGGPQSALAIDVNFPFKGVTNLSVSGQPMQLANDQAIFAMEIHHCTFPLEFSSLTVHGAGSTKAEGGEAGTQNTHQHYVVSDHDPDDEDDEIDDTDTDATLQHRELAQSASPFAGSSEVNIDYDRANKERSGSGSSSPTDTPGNGLGMGDGDYKSSSKGILCVDEFKTPEPLTSSKLLEFLEYAAPAGLDYAVNRYRREAERHYKVLDDHLTDREFIVGSEYTIADMSAWGWLDRASRVMKGTENPLAPYPNIIRWFQQIDARPAVKRARMVASGVEFKTVNDEETRRALFPSNFPSVP